MALAAGRAEAVRIGAPVSERVRPVDLDLLPGKAFPRAVAELGQSRIVAPIAQRRCQAPGPRSARFRGCVQAGCAGNTVGTGSRASSAFSARPIARAWARPRSVRSELSVPCMRPLGVPGGLAVTQHIKRPVSVMACAAGSRSWPPHSAARRSPSKPAGASTSSLLPTSTVATAPGAIQPACDRAASAVVASPDLYGRIEEDEVASLRGQDRDWGGGRVASARITLAAAVSPSLRRFSPISLIAAASLSRKVACAAPRGQGLEAERARSGEAIEHARVDQRRGAVRVPVSRARGC